MQHVSALASHYDKEACHYDRFNEDRSLSINHLIETILREHQVKAVLDAACGTGSQVFYLAERGYAVTGVDINQRMLAIAEQKALEYAAMVHLVEGDMRYVEMGQFDAVITIFNAIGHLTKEDFDVALHNIHHNLKPGGLYLFDIFNLDYLLHDNNITKLTIDWQKKSDNGVVREIQYSTITQEGVLASYDIYHEQENGKEPVISTAIQTLQVYTATQLTALLKKHGFQVIMQCDVDGSLFKQHFTERMLTVAQKHKS